MSESLQKITAEMDSDTFVSCVGSRVILTFETNSEALEIARLIKNALDLDFVVTIKVKK